MLGPETCDHKSAILANDALPTAQKFLGNKLSGLRAILLHGSRRNDSGVEEKNSQCRQSQQKRPNVAI